MSEEKDTARARQFFPEAIHTKGITAKTNVTAR